MTLYHFKSDLLIWALFDAYDSMDFVTVSTGLILPYWMGLPIRYIQLIEFNFLQIHLTIEDVYIRNYWIR